jgi:hypothetical protein
VGPFFSIFFFFLTSLNISSILFTFGCSSSSTASFFFYFFFLSLFFGWPCWSGLSTLLSSLTFINIISNQSPSKALHYGWVCSPVRQISQARMYSRRKNWPVFRACRYGLKYGYNKIIVTAWVTNHCYLGDQREVDTCSAVYTCVQVIQVCLDFSQTEFQIALAFVNLHDLIQSIASSIYFLHSSCLCFELLGFGDFC